ncbi:fatty acid desaturase [Saccharomonospora amisosensis]|uniref:Fatty acid desaturase n=1 Tax=Saccharomonospora amisosensis TaxID=1128677 RepID=A0A7X5UM59_9PSEU|nr:hypothetical protein [Saccharomonospora amisosensis]NIJ10564.1 fatty acid desaturase [Saccharomonospora amisosensis]
MSERGIGTVRLAALIIATLLALFVILLLGLPAWQPVLFFLVGMAMLGHVAGHRRRTAISA